MLKGLSKDLVFLFGGIFLSFALESERGALSGVVTSDTLSLVCLCLFTVLTGGYLAFRHYHGVLAGCGHEGSPHREAYNHLKASLTEEGNPARLYARWLEKSLRIVEHHFGEKTPENPTLIQRTVGLHKSAALWTAPALDWCTLITFIYPQALLMLGWVITGKAGPAEKVLGLMTESDPLPRYVTIGAIAVSVVSYANCYKILRRHGPCRDEAATVRLIRFSLWFILMTAAALAVDHLITHGMGGVGGSVILSSSIVGAIAGDVLVAVGSGFFGAAAGVAVMLKFSDFGGAIAAAIGCGLIGFLQAGFGDRGSLWARLRLRLRHSLLFWWLFLAGAICMALGFARLLPGSNAWPMMGPLLLFYGLLPALNAPFLWFSVGMTRALLWLGLERKGWWPYFYALLDAAVAVLVVVLLVGVIVVGVQTLDLVAVRAGAPPVIPVAPLLDAALNGFKTKSFRAEYWWIYTVMLSGMIPSLLNLIIGGFSLVRGIPILSRYLQASLPEGRAVTSDERNWVSLVLAIQLVTGMLLGVLAQLVFLPWWILSYVLPGMGLGIFTFAQTVEALNLPGRLWPW
jgi:hypothetical protein